jgi:hypothetical protein
VADEPTAEQLARQLSEFEVDQFVVAAASTLASLAFAKLDRGDLGEAKKAIDTLTALLPHVEGDLKPDLQSALANLHIAYAAAASA